MPESQLAMYSIEELKGIVKNYGGIRPAARYLGVHETSVRRYLNKHGYMIKDIMFEMQQEIAPDLQPSHKKITGDSIICADFHSPFISTVWLERLLGIGKETGLRQVVIAGDFFDMDRLSFWLKIANAEELAVSLKNELMFSEIILERLEEQFDTIWMLGGNHWVRLLKQISFTVDMETIMGMMDKKGDPRYNFIDLWEWVLIDNKVRVTHPYKARKLDGTLSRDIAILHEGEWVVLAHRHRGMEGFTPDGRPMVELGWMGDADRMRYKQYVDNAYYEWTNGFAVYQKNTLKSYTDYNYDWTEIDAAAKCNGTDGEIHSEEREENTIS